MNTTIHTCYVVFGQPPLFRKDWTVTPSASDLIEKFVSRYQAGGDLTRPFPPKNLLMSVLHRQDKWEPGDCTLFHVDVGRMVGSLNLLLKGESRHDATYCEDFQQRCGFSDFGWMPPMEITSRPLLYSCLFHLSGPRAAWRVVAKNATNYINAISAALLRLAKQPV